MIVACEPWFTDGGHAPFNSGLLATIRAAFSDEELFFFGAGAHIEELKKQLGVSLSESISWIEIVPPDQGRAYFGRLFCEIKIIRKLLRMFPQNSRGHLLLTSACSSTVVALKLVKRSQFEGIKVQVVLHGGLSGIVGRRYRRPILRFQEMRTALTLFGNSNIQYLVLEDCIRDTLLNNVPSLSGKVKTLDHPLPPNEAGSNSNDFCTPIRFGFLGLANEPKGFAVFVRLAKEMTTKYQDQVEFHAIGRFPAEGNPTLELDALATRPGVRRMSRVDFIQGVKQLHFIIFPHHAGHYDLSPSGTLLDAIAWEKPLVARSLPIFEDMLKKHGDIGYLFRNDMELREVVEHIIQKLDKLDYHRQVLNIRKARASRTPKALAASYREICRALAPLGQDYSRLVEKA
jgi:Glycosyl transferases group 1